MKTKYTDVAKRISYSKFVLFFLFFFTFYWLLEVMKPWIRRNFYLPKGLCLTFLSNLSDVLWNPNWTEINGVSFPDNSVGKESTCNAGHRGLIPGLGRSAGAGIGYPFLYSWASLVAQLVKNLPAMRETWVRSLGWEDPLEKGKATHSNILAWRIPWTV